jgi:hypothetical protein
MKYVAIIVFLTAATLNADVSNQGILYNITLQGYAGNYNFTSRQGQLYLAAPVPVQNSPNGTNPLDFLLLVDEPMFGNNPGAFRFLTHSVLHALEPSYLSFYPASGDLAFVTSTTITNGFQLVAQPDPNVLSRQTQSNVFSAPSYLTPDLFQIYKGYIRVVVTTNGLISGEINVTGGSYDYVPDKLYYATFTGTAVGTFPLPYTPSVSCTYTVTPSQTSFPSTGGTATLQIQPNSSSCSWNITGVPSWLTVSTSSGTGSQTVNLTVTPNTGSARNATLSIAGQTINISQAAAAVSCSYTATPSQTSFPSTGGSATLQIQSNQPSCSWTITGTPGWLTLSTSSASGTQTVNLTVATNTGSTIRSAILSIAGQTITIIQAAPVSATCDFTVSAPQTSFPAAGSTGAIQIQASTSTCNWSISGSPSWIILSPTSGTGSQTVGITVSANTGTTRTATLTIAGQTLTITQAAASTTPPPPITSGLYFVPVTPCRLMETRPDYNYEGRTGDFGPPFLTTGATRTLVPQISNVCHDIPAKAKAYSLNVPLVPRGAVDYVTVWPAGEARPDFWTVRSPDGIVVANSALVKAGAGGGIQVFASNPTDLVIDINGYFTEDTGLLFYPLTPCRVIDTRSDYRPQTGPFGPPTMGARETRAFRFPATPYCSIPEGASAYSMSLTVVPPAPLAYLTAWPSGGSQPNVSSINSPASRVLANGTIVPAGSDGGINIFTFNRTDFLVDINGYFAPEDGTGRGLLYFPVTQCRLVNTQDQTLPQPFGPPAMESETTRTISLSGSTRCPGLPSSAKAWALNVTATPNGSALPFLTMWPSGNSRPNASQLNAFQGQTVSNSAIVPAGTGGSIDLFVFRKTNVALEVAGFFNR